MGDNDNTLVYKNFYLFYKNLYERLFSLINTFIDEKHFNIIKLKNNLIDFLDSYSYYLVKKKLIAKDEATRNNIDLLKDLKQFDNFYKTISAYPSNEYIITRNEFRRVGLDINKLSDKDYIKLIKEYYTFFNEILFILKQFILISSDCGFLPNVKSKLSTKSIGFANYDLFFTKLEELKIKFSDITNKIDITNSFKSRRCSYCILTLFSPYFSNQEVLEHLETKIDFKFLEDKKIIESLKSIRKYKDILDIPLELTKNLEKDILKDLKENISHIKRFISYEFGELDMSPKITKKYGYDPTNV